MKDQIKWVLNTMPKSDDRQLPIMSLSNVAKARFFHSTFPQYSVTPLDRLDGMAQYLGLAGLCVKNESFRFGLNAFKVLGGSFAMAKYIAKEMGRDVSEMTYDYLTSEALRKEFGQATFFPAKGIRKEQVEFVVSTEPTDGGIYRGHRGRMEIRVDVKGVSCHGSAPERGDNAIYKMADILQDVRALNENPADETVEIKGLVKMLDPKYNPEHFEDARFLGRGTCTTSQIFYTSPSRCAVADSCSISIDRRMTAGETWDSCLQEIRDLPSVKKYGDDVQVSMYMYDRPSWTGEVYETECYFPTWINKENAAHVQALVDAHHALWGDKRIGHADAEAKRDAMHLRDGRPLTDKWTFSTNGVAIQGRYGIPCVGFGPGAESQAHAPNEITWKMDLVTCAALYAAVPGNDKEENKTADVSQFRAGKTNNNIQ